MKKFLFTVTPFIVISLACFSQTSRISGQLTYDNTVSTPLKDVEVYLKTATGTILDSSTSTVTGYYHFENVSFGQYQITAQSNEVPGGINNIDALQVLKHYIGYITLTGLSLLAGDADFSGYINSIDALYCAKLFAGYLSGFPFRNWIFEQPTVTISDIATVIQNIKGICVGDVNQSYFPEAVPGVSCPNIPAFVYGGQTYNTLQIGTQCWMKENLNIGTMVTSNLTGDIHSDCINNGIIEKYCYNNDPANCAIYGGLYDWNEMMQYTTTPGVQGICPIGWHLPTDEEWCTMTTYLDATVNCMEYDLSGTTIGGKLKETGLTHWISPNAGATNESGFTALGAGSRDNYGNFYGLFYNTEFWSSSEYSSEGGIGRFLSYGSSDIFRFYDLKTSGFSLRCVRNN